MISKIWNSTYRHDVGRVIQTLLFFFAVLFFGGSDFLAVFFPFFVNLWGEFIDLDNTRYLDLDNIFDAWLGVFGLVLLIGLRLGFILGGLAFILFLIPVLALWGQRVPRPNRDKNPYLAPTKIIKQF
jgi:hypothetical protein